MLKFIKKLIPKQIKYFILRVKVATIDVYRKNKLAEKMRIKHQVLLKNIKAKKKIKVVFLVINESVWKVDTVFIRMLKDPLFEPEILVCPYMPYGEERMLEDMNQAYKYFKSKGYPVEKSLKDDGSWIKLKEIAPDIVFFTNPHNLTRKEYYEDAYSNYLSCYVPYHHEVVSNVEQYNQKFHVAQWKIFVTNRSSLDKFNSYSRGQALNVFVSGYPAMEEFLEKMELESIHDPWKTNDGRLRVIWAPHHSVEMNDNVPYSNFLRHAELFKKIANTYKDKVIWSFKPHPLLKVKLYDLPNWGKVKTDEYYDYWDNQSFTQLDNGEYVNLFCTSDAMIHDSGSFLAEYLYMKKPVLFNMSPINQGQHYSEFGLQALKACSRGRETRDILSFIDSLFNEREIKKEHLNFLENNVLEFFIKTKPSEFILKNLHKEFDYYR